MTAPDTVVLLVRHGETAWHDPNRYCGSTDLPLTETGERQAASLAAWAGSIPELTAVYSSTMTRALRTAEPAAKAANLPLRTDPRLVELDFGLAEGLTGDEIAARWPDERAAFTADPYANPLPGGEDPHAALERGTAGVIDAAAAHPGGHVLIVFHSSLLRLVTCRLAGIDPARYRSEFPKVANTSGAVLRRGGAGWELLAFNPALLPGTRPW